jgi:hypothetical protein
VPHFTNIVRIVSPLGSGRMVADSETTIFDVGAKVGIDAAAFDYLGRLVPTDVLAVIDRSLARSRRY